MTSERVRISKSVLDGLKAQVEEQKNLASINARLEKNLTTALDQRDEARRWAIKLRNDGLGMYQEILELKVLLSEWVKLTDPKDEYYIYTLNRTKKALEETNEPV